MAQTVVQYAVIQAAAEDCKSTGKQLDDLFDQLVQRMQPLTESWSGQAREMWDEKQRQWDQNLADLNSFLNRVATALPQIADGYQQTDKKIGGFFG